MQVFENEWEANSVDILLTDPPYNVLPETRDVFTEEDIKDFALLCSKVMKENW